ncbi:Pho80p NDAI_0C02640 [Naumovozyma dairenensis CBS 421]|uniref:Cyclin-like domain-containing protein n=1 Tax=Naumovozyma dairenensis (strain ATCC 10597 / BCRC 20456 / CBS 421 / NBRC 0211 / NRRL Y-12639) TaxID=1071378 RepID=G0W813_NAUDC|nr:hypothetical protein NDAI_0C02640 [Naumovozyma dairenensis CBS 421]CCD23924.1 hypothetical protein NDAI_0C02640 [Naumovozyma dairenensis CBS 421]
MQGSSYRDESKPDNNICQDSNINVNKTSNTSSDTPSTQSHSTPNVITDAENPKHVKITLPIKFMECPRRDLVVLISRMLVTLIKINDTKANDNNLPSNYATRFHSRVIPGISIGNYLLRLTKFCILQPSVLLTAVYYIDLLSAVFPSFSFNSLTAHRFILTAVIVASKSLCDSCLSITHYAKYGGVQPNELLMLEAYFLKLIKYRVLPRDKNTDLCSMEYHFDTFALNDGQIKESGTSFSYRQLPHSGYNVLHMYYRRIIDIIGVQRPISPSPDAVTVDYFLMRPRRISSASSIESAAATPLPKPNPPPQLTSVGESNYDNNNDSIGERSNAVTFALSSTISNDSMSNSSYGDQPNLGSNIQKESSAVDNVQNNTTTISGNNSEHRMKSQHKALSPTVAYTPLMLTQESRTLSALTSKKRRLSGSES